MTTPAATLDLVTEWIIKGWLYLLAAWEVTILICRGLGVPAATVSMVGQRMAYHGMPWVAYFWAGLGAHIFINWTWNVWSTPIPGIAWWLIGLGYLLIGQFFPAYHGWLVWPPFVALLSFVLAFVLFPQRAIWMP